MKYRWLEEKDVDIFYINPLYNIYMCRSKFCKYILLGIYCVCAYLLPNGGLHNKIYLIQSNSAVKKCTALKKAIVEKDVNPKWRPINGCDGRLIVNILIIRLPFPGFGTKNSSKLLHQFFFGISLPSQPLLGCLLIFFAMAFFRATLTTRLFCISFIIAYCVANILPSLSVCLFSCIYCI